MDAIRQLAITLGATAIIGGVVEAIAPPQKYKNIIRTVTGLFILLTVLSSCRSAQKSFDINNSVKESMAQVQSDSEAAMRAQLKTQAETNLEQAVKSELESEDIVYRSVKAYIDVNGDTFTVEKVAVAADEKDIEKVKRVGEKLKINFEITS